MLRAAKLGTMLYAPAQNIAFLATLMCCDNNEAFTSLQHLLVVDIDCLILFVIARTFGLCPTYQFSLINPLIWNTILYFTPLHWNAWIEPIAIGVTIITLLLLLRIWFTNMITTYGEEFITK